MALYAACVMCIPSQLRYVDGSAHAAAPSKPHIRRQSKLYSPSPAPQQALRVLAGSKPDEETETEMRTYASKCTARIALRMPACV